MQKKNILLILKKVKYNTTNIKSLNEQIDDLLKDNATKKEIKDYIKSKFNHYKSSPEGCIDYIQECLYVSMPGLGYVPFQLWETQKRMILDIVSCMFDKNKDMYVLLGSRQCGKTTCSLALCDWLTTFYDKYNVVLIHVDDSRGKNACEEFRKLRSEKSKYMYFKPTKNALTHQIFENNASFQLQSTQKSKSSSDVDTGRGLSVNLLWIDEAGSVDLEKLESSIFPTTSTTFMFCKENNIPHIILLSGTANGRVGIGKKFYTLWKQVEPPNNLDNPSMGGYKLFWKDIPGKDEKWYQSQAAMLTPRKLHQEIDCIFYGTESSLFSDNQIIKIQSHSNSLNIIEPNYQYITPQNYLSKGTFYKRLESNKNYIMGIDCATGRGNDYTSIEVIDNDTQEQVFELRDNLIQNDDLVKTINNITYTFLYNHSNIVISIEPNMTGSAVISDLKALNPIYKTLIYRNTISSDISIKNKNEIVDYNKCEYGITITNSTRELLINYIFKYISNNLSLIHSKELMQEIESLEIDKNDKVVGYPHDDSVFALGHCLLLKNRGRKQNIYSIFNYCSDILKDSEFKQTLQLSIENNFDDELIRDTLNESNSSNDFILGESGLLSTLKESYSSNTIDNGINSNILLPFNIMSTSTNTIDMNSFNEIRQQLIQQNTMISQKIKDERELKKKMNEQKKNSNNPNMNKILNKINKKSKREKIKEDIYFSNEDLSKYNSEDDDWFGVVL